MEVNRLEILSDDNIVKFLVLFMPGFIFIKISSLLVASEDIDFSQNWYEAIAYGVIFSGLTYVAYIAGGECVGSVIPFIVIGMVVLPILAPFVIKWLRNMDFIKNHILRQERSAWDYVFSSRKTYWVILHLKDDRVIGGLYATQSFTSSFPHTQDIYLEELWTLDSDNNFVQKIPQSAGLWIIADEISSIEFFNYTEDTEEQNNES